MLKNNIKYVFLLLEIVGILCAQTKIDLRSQSKRVDFSGAQSTKPFRAGATLPPTCSAGEVFLLLNASPGANIHTCVGPDLWAAQGTAIQSGEPGRVLKATSSGYEWTTFSGDLAGGSNATVVGIQGKPVSSDAPASGDVMQWDAAAGKWTPQPASGAVQVQLEGTPLGSRPIQNYLSGIGMTNIVSDTGSSINIQHGINSAIVQTRANDQSGADRLIAVRPGTDSNFIGGLSPVLQRYTPGMVLQFRPDRSCGASPQLDIDGNGPLPLWGATGSTPITCSAGEQFAIWYDAAARDGAGAWRKNASDSVGATASTLLTDSATLVRTTGASTLTGTYDFSGAAQLRVKTAATAPDPAACATTNHAGSLYFQTGDPSEVPTTTFVCAQIGPSTFAWKGIGIAAGASDPATACTVGQIYLRSDNRTIWICNEANSWVPAAQSGAILLSGPSVGATPMTGTWTVPQGVEHISVLLCGGGGGGAGSNTAGSGGGGGGAGCEDMQFPTSDLTNVAYSVGPGGAGGSAGSSPNGADGGNTSLTLNYPTPITVTVTGGKGAIGTAGGGIGVGVFVTSRPNPPGAGGVGTAAARRDQGGSGAGARTSGSSGNGLIGGMAACPGGSSGAWGQSSSVVGGSAVVSVGGATLYGRSGAGGGANGASAANGEDALGFCAGGGGAAGTSGPGFTGAQGGRGGAGFVRIFY